MSGRWESNPIYILPKDAYDRYTTARYYKALAINPIKIIPIKLKVKEREINVNVLIFEKPIKLIPNSSGKGEAMINPPTKNVSHLKDL